MGISEKLDGDAVLVDGERLQDYKSVGLIKHGGKVTKTMGLDGASINRSSEQGGELVVHMQEDSRSQNFLRGLLERQQASGAGASVVVRNGAEILVELNNAHLSQSNCSSYTFTCTELTDHRPLRR